jgi:putative membrane protein
MVVSHWSASPLALALLAAVVAVHLLGMRGLAADAGGGRRSLPPAVTREAVIFYAGLLAVLLAVVSSVGYWAQRLIWVRSVQDLLLAIVAPLLIVLGAPWLVLYRGLRGRPWAGRREREKDANGRPDDYLAWRRLPIAATLAFNIAWCCWHLPVLYDAARSSPLAFAGQVGSYLGFGMLFWLQLVRSRPHVPALTPIRRVMLLVGTAGIGAVLAMVLVFGSTLLYPGYLASHHHAFSVIADQQVGGAVLWVIPLIPYFAVAVALLVRWLNEEESAELATGIDRLLKPPRSAWSSRPGLR